MEDEIADIIQSSYNREELYDKLEKMIIRMFCVEDYSGNKQKLALDIKSIGS